MGWPARDTGGQGIINVPAGDSLEIALIYFDRPPVDAFIICC